MRLKIIAHDKFNANEDHLFSFFAKAKGKPAYLAVGNRTPHTTLVARIERETGFATGGVYGPYYKNYLYAEGHYEPEKHRVEFTSTNRYRIWQTLEYVAEALGKHIPEERHAKTELIIEGREIGKLSKFLKKRPRSR